MSSINASNKDATKKLNPAAETGDPATSEPAVAEEWVATADDHASRKVRAEAVIRRNVLWALGGGILPLPILDVAAVTAIELKMLKELANIYQVEFSPGIARKIIYSLLANIGLVGVGTLLGGSIAKLIPFLGVSLGFISVSVLVGSFTDSLGQTVLIHLEGGGTLEDFSPTAMANFFRKEFDKAKDKVRQMQERRKTRQQDTGS
jgi:uncharacterized protein (DUF697 family)